MMQQGPMISTRLNPTQVQMRGPLPLAGGDGQDAWLEEGEEAVATLNEEEAKGAWLAKLTHPSWGAVATAVTNVHSDVGHAAGDQKEAAKADMLMWTQASKALVDIARTEKAKAVRPTKMDGPSWDAVVAAVLEVALGGKVARGKKVALAQQAVTSLAKKDKDTAMNELLGNSLEAKEAWLSRMDAPTWAALAEAVSEVVSFVNAPAGDDEPVKEAAKEAWLERVDAATWAEAAPAINTIAHEEKAKEAWLAKIAEAIVPVVAAGALAPGAKAWRTEGDAGAGEQIFSGNCAALHTGVQNIIQAEETRDDGFDEAAVMQQTHKDIMSAYDDKNFIPNFAEDDIKNVATYVISMAQEGWD